ncbi:MAG TPA: hypothetical protein VIJ99_02700, partial [Acidimicrobiales bacterium]
AAALDRLGEDVLMSERLDPEWFVPQVGQGTLALEVRSTDAATRELLATLNDHDAMSSLLAERAFLRELGSGCSIPAGAFATVRDGTISINGVMLALDGATSVRANFSGTEPEFVGRALATTLRDELGGGELAGWT